MLYHLIAARYGTTPEAVRETWPADDFYDAVNLYDVTGRELSERGSRK